MWNPATRLTGILEFTLGCVSALDAYFLAHGTCRGAAVQLKRSGTRANGKLTMTAVTSPYGIDQLPESLPLRDQLTALWGSKRQDSLISTAPHRPIVEPPANPDENIARRLAAGLDMRDLDVDRYEVTPDDIRSLLAARFTIRPPVNGEAKS